MAVPYTFANQTGPIPLNELDANFAAIPNYANTAGTVTESVQANITAVGTLSSLSVSAGITSDTVTTTLLTTTNSTVTGTSTSGSISTGAITGTSAVLSGSLTVANITASGNLAVTKNLTIANITASGPVTATGNVTGGNLITAGQVIATGNISGDNISTTTDVSIGGNLVVTGNATVNGTTTTINVQTLNIADKDVVVANNVSTSALIDGAGIIAGNPTVSSLVYSHANLGWGTANNFNIGGNLNVTGAGFATTPGNATSNTQIATTAFVRNIIPTGVITLWYGSIVSIPAGWYLCDGNNGTPDLRDRFIVGAGNVYAVAASAGSDTITPTGNVSATASGTALTEAQMPKHYHLMLGPNSVTSPQGSGSQVGVYGGGTPDDGTQAYGTYSTGGDAASGTQTTGTANADSHTHSISATFTGDSATNLPPYYALAYIMKA